MGESGRSTRWAGLIPAGYSAVLTTLITGPLLGSGYLLLRDAVSTPRSYLTDSALGLGDAAPRAVPQDALLAALSPIVDGGLLVKAILIVALWAAGYGAAVLARELLAVSLGPQLVATTLTLWNPFVAERLLQGHWSLLAGYAALPWTALAAYRLRSAISPGRRYSAVAAWGALAGCLAAAGLTPTGSLLAGCVALLTVGRRNLPGTLVLLVAASAPWLAATALSGAGAEPSDSTGVAAFAARAEPGLGTLGSLAGLGGIWNADAVPDSRTTPIALVATILLLAVVASGIRSVLTAVPEDRAGLHVRRTLFALAVAVVVVPALASTGWGMEVMRWLVVEIPGAGLLRDTQKYVALAVPAFALCAAAGCRALAARIAARTTKPTENQEFSGGGSAAIPVAVLFAVLLVAPLLDLAFGVGGSVRPVHYPLGWQRVAEKIDAPGDVAVLPGGMFRRFPYSGKVAVLDPAPRMLPNDVLQTGRLPVRGLTVSGEGTRAVDAENALLHGDSARRLADLGVGWVLVERSTPGPLGDSVKTMPQLEKRYEDENFALYRVPGEPTRATETLRAHRIIAITAHLLWATLLIGGLLVAAIYRPIRR
ncbi:hypothetical protein [Nocardia aurea]|uniref:hypothetical protein n=2 Tax=Nocardia TaxID=1817 RepID=UPI001E60D8EC|nr:hypothetical protein [Nocardia aurea]